MDFEEINNLLSKLKNDKKIKKNLDTSFGSAREASTDKLQEGVLGQATTQGDESITLRGAAGLTTAIVPADRVDQEIVISQGNQMMTKTFAEPFQHILSLFSQRQDDDIVPAIALLSVGAIAILAMSVMSQSLAIMSMMRKIR